VSPVSGYDEYGTEFAKGILHLGEEISRNKAKPVKNRDFYLLKYLFFGIMLLLILKKLL